MSNDEKWTHLISKSLHSYLFTNMGMIITKEKTRNTSLLLFSFLPNQKFDMNNVWYIGNQNLIFNYAGLLIIQNKKQNYFWHLVT